MKKLLLKDHEVKTLPKLVLMVPSEPSGEKEKQPVQQDHGTTEKDIEGVNLREEESAAASKVEECLEKCEPGKSMINFLVAEEEEELVGAEGEQDEYSIAERSLVNSPARIRPWHLPLVHTKVFKVTRRSFFENLKIPMSAKLYSVAEIQLATKGFGETKLLGQRSLGFIYRAELPKVSN